MADPDGTIRISLPQGSVEDIEALSAPGQLVFRQVYDEGPIASGSGAPGPSASEPSAGDCGRQTASDTSAPPACLRAIFDAPGFACPQTGPAADEPSYWSVACDQAGSTRFLLHPAAVAGTDVKNARVQAQDTSAFGGSAGSFVVSLSFTGSGQTKWTALTQLVRSTPGCPASSAPACQVAIVLDGVVQSSPVIQDVIYGDAQVSGDFDQKKAEELANILKYGSLPVMLRVVMASTANISTSPS